MSTDDTAIYINDSEDANSKYSISLALQDVDDSSRNKKPKNYFISSLKLSGMGMMIHLTCTFAADGSSAPIYIIISCLKESEMPSSIYPEVLYVEEVPGLSSAGAIDTSVKNVGYIVFVRGGKNNISNNDDNIDETDEINEDSNDEEMPDL
eukprot:10122258-Ditylum_brightwellii.AAC.1